MQNSLFEQLNAYQTIQNKKKFKINLKKKFISLQNLDISRI